ncbi:hypothetical protein [Methanosarcina mazei]|nr:hypothetical protein [Methanosarcina mazei]
MRKDILDILNKINPYLFLITLLIGILWAIAYNNIKLIVLALYIIAPVTCAIVWIFYHKEMYTELLKFSPIKKLDLLYILIYVVTLIILFIYSTRPLIYFILIALLYVFVLYQILSSQRSWSYLLIEIILLNANLIYGVLFKYPLYFGGTDTFSHIYFSQIISLTGHPIPNLLDPSYSYFPPFHILVSIVSQILDIDIDYALFTTISIAYFVLPIFLYYIIFTITQNNQIALLSCFFNSFLVSNIYYSFYPIPRGLVFVFFIIFLYSLIKDNLSFRFLGLILSTSIVLFHSASVVQFLFILCIIIFLEHLLQTQNIIRKDIIIFLLIIFAAYWFYVAIDFSTSIIVYLLNPDKIKDITFIQPSIDFLIFFQDHISMGIILFFVILGFSYVTKKPSYLSVIGILTMILLVFYLPNPIKMTTQILEMFGFYRFELFASPFIAIMAGLGFLVFLNTFSKSNKMMIGLSFLLIFMAVFTSIITTNNASDFNKNTSTTYFTNDEMNAMNFIEYKTSSNVTLYSDYFMYRAFYPKHFFEADNDYLSYGLKFYNVNMILDIESISLNKGYIIFRKSEFEERKLLLLGSSSRVYEYKYTNESSNILENNLLKLSKIYKSDRNEIFYN